MTDLRDSIKSDLAKMSDGALRDNAMGLLATLGYHSDRTINLDSSPATFLDFLRNQPGEIAFNETKALFNDWKSAGLLFQLTDDELSDHASLFKEDALAPGLLRSYVFFAIELTGDNYHRSKLTDIARQINRVFPMPVMVLIKHLADKHPALSIAVINRRQNKRDAAKDVLGKVTIIRDISLREPHRGHLDILASFALPNLVHPQRQPISNFDALHAAWEEIFNVELLNERFYRELANWYFWAIPQVTFPDDVEKDEEKRNATSLIRLLTRLIFCWFLKEKGLIPEALFVEAELKSLLKDVTPEASSYYQAILQNLFFATLNQRMGKDKSTGKPYRAFALDEGFQKNRSTYGVDNLYRYESLFRDPASALAPFADVPFLNGGLFECLDRTEEATKRKLYVDGFSRNPKKRPGVPNELFFGDERVIDLSHAFGDNKRRKEKVRGLLRILHAYKFTIIENTPIDQEVALDPELLGKVFENLLASYNEETKTTARKQTGSFYTPRPIVEYMVDESLKAHLANALTQSGMLAEDAEVGLEILFAYTERVHPFTDAEADVLLVAIHTCKVLDPACGSGAFPMGMLHKLVYVIHKLDPENAKWKELQIAAAARIPDSSAREAAIAAIERDFADNPDDYGRKLYLIENCLYGVDIQPIAIQISKLRFFISLICDQRTNRDKAKNHGIRPLPNLETKFVAADTLVTLKAGPIGDLFESPKVKALEAELQRVRHDYFAVTTRQRKLALQKRDRELRDALSDELAQGTFADQESSRKLADWNPYDPQEWADFFEPLWMFDQSLVDGFDLVIGNPPYLRIQGIQQTRPQSAKYYKAHYAAATGSFDLYVVFMERGLELLRDGGILNFINPDKWVNAEFGQGIRRLVVKQRSVRKLISLSAHRVFSASTYSSLLWMQNTPAASIQYARVSPEAVADTSLEDELVKLNLSAWSTIRYESLSAAPWVLSTGEGSRAMSAIHEHDRIVSQMFRKIFQGIASSKDSVYFLQNANDCGLTYEAFSTELGKRVEIEKGLVRPLLMGNQVHRYDALHSDTVVVFPYSDTGTNSDEGPFLLAPSALQRDYPMGWNYLKQCESVLRARERGRFDVTEWYQFGRKQGINEGDKVKLLAPDISLGGNFSIDRHGTFYTTTTLYGYIKDGRTWESYEFLLAMLNSKVLWFYLKNSGSVLANGYFRYKPAYLNRFPIPEVSREHEAILSKAVKCLLKYKATVAFDPVVSQFVEDLIDACVMECYFHVHMAERDLLFLDDLAPHLAAFDPDASDTKKGEFLTALYSTLNASSSKIRNRLLRLTADSPDLLAVIKAEGAT